MPGDVASEASGSASLRGAVTRIPEHLLFVWFGKQLPLFAALAIRSALQHNPSARVSLLHDGALDVGALAREPRLARRQVDIDALLRAARDAPLEAARAPLDTQRLLQVWRALRAPAARSNLVRLLVLYAEGGVYLDTDTLTLRSLRPLLERPAFCGLEEILWPRDKLRLDRGHFWLRGPALMGTRFVLGHVPYGYRVHSRMRGWYERAVNNAVLGFERGHVVLERALRRITELERGQWTRRFRLGTHLLQEVLAGGKTALDLLAPAHFYPLGPVMSLHYFRSYPDAAALARELLTDQTYVVHWYGSVSNLLPLGEDYMRAHADRVLFAHLCRRTLDGG